jgi:large subunit ribosomal protein L4
MKLSMTSLDAKAAGSIELNDGVFGITEIRSDLLQRTVRWQLAKRQSGTHDTQNRDEVSRTTAKIYKQKGSGKARHGAANAPIFRGGGVAHGPHPRSHAHDLPKKVRALALRHALSAKAKDGSLVVLKDAVLDAPKTAALKAQFEKMGLTNALIIAGVEIDTNFRLAARNIPNVDVLPFAGLNVYDILRRKTLVLTKDAVDAIHARYAEMEAA